MTGILNIMALPFLACLILTGMHAYLGLHVIERQVIFVDLALAQIAALGASLALVFGYGMNSASSYWISLAFAVTGAAIFSLTRFKKQKIPQEAVIGITYAVSAALLLVILSRSGEGDEHIKQALVGNILLIRGFEVLKIFVVYLGIGIFHYLLRRKFFLISHDPDKAYQAGLKVRFWDFLFYASFALVVTSSVKIAGVLLVFAFLVVPSSCAVLFFTGHKSRLIFGWTIGFLASILGMLVSYHLDFPTGASVVCVFGLLLIVLSFVKAVCKRLITQKN